MDRSEKLLANLTSQAEHYFATGSRFKGGGCQELWKPAPGLLDARECAYVRNIERGDVVGADNLHHSRRRVRRAGHKHGNLAIVECVGKEPKLPSILHAH